VVKYCATALVRLDGFVVRSQVVHDGEHWLLVETEATRSSSQTEKWLFTRTFANVSRGVRFPLCSDVAHAEQGFRGGDAKAPAPALQHLARPRP
jgi:hypothetical protein